MPDLKDIYKSECIYQPTKWIRHITVSDRVIIMDLRSGKYVLLDEIASDMWNWGILQGDPLNCINQLAVKYKVDYQQCKSDLIEFASNCKKQGFICTDSNNNAKNVKIEVKRQNPNLLNALNNIFKTKSMLKKFDFPKVYNTYYQFKKPKNPEFPDKLLTKSLKSFRLAENFFPVNNAHFDCLPRSLSLFRFLIHVGIDCDHCIGVQRFPFIAHAWVEVQNKIVGDEDLFVSKFSVINRI